MTTCVRIGAAIEGEEGGAPGEAKLPDGFPPSRSDYRRLSLVNRDLQTCQAQAPLHPRLLAGCSAVRVDTSHPFGAAVRTGATEKPAFTGHPQDGTLCSPRHRLEESSIERQPGHSLDRQLPVERT